MELENPPSPHPYDLTSDASGGRHGTPFHQVTKTLPDESYVIKTNRAVAKDTKAWVISKRGRELLSRSFVLVRSRLTSAFYDIWLMATFSSCLWQIWPHVAFFTELSWCFRGPPLFASR